MIASLVAGVLVTQGVLAHVGKAYGQLCPVSEATAYTAAHVVDGNLFGEWEASNGDKGLFTVRWRDEEKDLALVEVIPMHGQVQATRFPFHYPVRKKEPPVGEAVGAIGFRQWALGWYPSVGYYLGLDEVGDMGLMLPVHFGMSGGCVLTEEKGQREVAGIVTGVMLPEKTGWLVGFGRPLWREKGVK